MKSEIKKVIKRDGRESSFDEEKIITAITKAVAETEEFNQAETQRLGQIVVRILARSKGKTIPSVEEIQDIVEQVLMAAGHFETAKRYIIYRSERAKDRGVKQTLGIVDDLDLSLNSLKVLEKKRYLLHDENNHVVETPSQMIRRVSSAIAKMEKTQSAQKQWEENFYQVISRFEFVPAGCYFRGAGRNGNLTNCFVLPVEDSMEEIFDAVKWTALVHQKGGGTGFNFSNLRPKGDFVKASRGFSSGPVSFMRVFDAATRQVMQGGFLQGANMGILDIDHPDIFEFISCKTQDDEITNFNISIGMTDAFMKAVKKDSIWKLKNPRNGETVQTVSAKKLFSAIVTLAWQTGDPGLIYLDRINEHNPVLESMGPIKATNPCGEQPLHDFDCCNLGSINLAKFALEGQMDWTRLAAVVRTAVRFLDNGVDASNYPIPQIAQMAQTLRRIGLGVMGWADLLYQLKIRYDSGEGIKFAQKTAKFIQETSWSESEELAKSKGVFPAWEKSQFEHSGPLTQKERKVRNVAITTIAPTGTISMVADCSSGIEPVFALSYIKNVVDQAGLTYTNKYFHQALQDHYNLKGREKISEILALVQEVGSVEKIKGLPSEIKETFRVAFDISPQWHIKMQAAWQKHTDNAVSKTINFPKEATIEDIEEAYLKAWELGCKGITVYRDQSKSVQVLSIKANKKAKKNKQIMQSQISISPLKYEQLSQAHKAQKNEIKDENACPECGVKMVFKEGCVTCDACGFSKCSL